MCTGCKCLAQEGGGRKRERDLEEDEGGDGGGRRMGETWRRMREGEGAC